ncbi:MAG: molybdopterin-dependent oxidoreductase [Myxococcota bacterium]
MSRFPMSPLHHLQRRWFLQGSAFTGANLLLGCGDDEAAPGGTGADPGGENATSRATTDEEQPPGRCDSLEGGELEATIPLGPEPQIPLDQKFGQGWDARLYHDLSILDDDTLVTPNELFYIRTERPDQLTVAPEDWTITLEGLVAETVTLRMSDLEPLVEPMGVHVLECSGNSDGGAFGLLSAAEWDGVPLAAIFDRVDAMPAATRVLIEGFDGHSVPSRNNHSTPGAAWVFTFEELLEAGAFLATHMNGELLPPDHGEPVRLFVPGWYGCCHIKWVQTMQWVSDDAPSTSQMREFASRTHQNGVPNLASQFRPATMSQSAMPVRVERWRLVDDTVAYRIVGVMWGGATPTDALSISFDGGRSFAPVDFCRPPPTDNQSWSLWEHLWQPTEGGTFTVRLRVDDPMIPTIRLDGGWYDRTITLA